MPAIRRYLVKQTRMVQVDANHPGDACDIARAAFENGQNADNGVIDGPQGVFGNTMSKIRITKLKVDEV